MATEQRKAIEQIVSVRLFVKAETTEQASEFAKKKLLTPLNLWVTEDGGGSPFPEGSLLYYTFVDGI